MGRRKSKRQVSTGRKAAPIPTTFNCPFCNHEKSVECTMDREKRVGSVRCNVCDAKYGYPIHALSDPVDVYSAWLDACEQENALSDVSDEGSLAPPVAGRLRATADSEEE